MQNWTTLSTAVGESCLPEKGGMGTRTEAASDAGSEELIFGVEEGGDRRGGGGVVHTGPKVDEDGIRRTRTVTVVIDPNGGRGVKR